MVKPQRIFYFNFIEYNFFLFFRPSKEIFVHSIYSNVIFVSMVKYSKSNVEFGTSEHTERKRERQSLVNQNSPSTIEFSFSSLSFWLFSYPESLVEEKHPSGFFFFFYFNFRKRKLLFFFLEFYEYSGFKKCLIYVF